MRRYVSLISAVSLLFLFAGCSVVFTGSITGELHDLDAYEADEAVSGIADAAVYLYTEEEPWVEDLAAWNGGTGPMPDYPVDTAGNPLEPRYFLKTVSDEDGGFTFNGFIWEDLFPQYGKSGDRKEIFLLYHQEDYGLTANDTPVYIVSDVTNRLPPTLLERIYNRATIQGTMTDTDDGEPLANVNVRVFVPTDWSYDTAGAITGVTWNEDPTYIITTDETGRYEREISFPMKPDSMDNAGTCFVHLTFGRNGYIAEHSADSDITDGGWDRDGDGSIEDGEDDPYYKSPVIEADTTVEMAEIALAGEYNTATITGTVEDVADGEGVANVNVDIYVPESWDYDGGGAMINVLWPEKPSYSLVTGATGEYTTEIEFAREPELTDNEETTRVRILFNRNGYITHDSDITDTGWDADDDGTDDPYYESDWITNGRSETLNTISIKQTEFSETLEGQVIAGMAAKNGLTVKLFITETPPGDPIAADADRTATTHSRLLGESTIQDGYFSIENITWTDEAYTGTQSSLTCYICVAEDDGWPTNPATGEITIHSGTTNWVNMEVTLP